MNPIQQRDFWKHARYVLKKVREVENTPEAELLEPRDMALEREVFYALNNAYVTGFNDGKRNLK